MNYNIKSNMAGTRNQWHFGEWLDFIDFLAHKLLYDTVLHDCALHHQKRNNDNNNDNNRLS